MIDGRLMMANVVNQDDQNDVVKVINTQITAKISYLQELQQAISQHDDRKIYALLDNQRYASAILHTEKQENDHGVINLVDNLSAQLSNYLSTSLIQYLGKTYPFFYYEEYKQGHFKVFFGNWWDRREFGELDVLNIRFAFDQDEYSKLSQAFELAKSSKKYNSEQIQSISAENDHLQDLIDNANQREAQKEQLQAQLKETNTKTGMPWESGKQKEARQTLVDQLSELEDEDELARNAVKQIKNNEAKVLALSKENTILSYEQKSIVDTFGSFADFEVANRNLYADYLHTFMSEKQVDDND